MHDAKQDLLAEWTGDRKQKGRYSNQIILRHERSFTPIYATIAAVNKEHDRILHTTTFLFIDKTPSD
jgi:hypothetical protein